MIVDLVTFRVRKDKLQEFQKHTDDRLKLLRGSRGFISHVLMRNVEDPTEFRAEVRWVNREYRDRFETGEDAESRALTQKGTAILESPPTHCLLESF